MNLASINVSKDRQPLKYVVLPISLDFVYVGYPLCCLRVDKVHPCSSLGSVVLYPQHLMVPVSILSHGGTCFQLATETTGSNVVLGSSNGS